MKITGEGEDEDLKITGFVQNFGMQIQGDYSRTKTKSLKEL